MPQAIDRLLATPMMRPRLPAIKPLLSLIFIPARQEGAGIPGRRVNWHKAGDRSTGKKSGSISTWTWFALPRLIGLLRRPASIGNGLDVGVMSDQATSLIRMVYGFC